MIFFVFLSIKTRWNMLYYIVWIFLTSNLVESEIEKACKKFFLITHVSDIEAGGLGRGVLCTYNGGSLVSRVRQAWAWDFKTRSLVERGLRGSGKHWRGLDLISFLHWFYFYIFIYSPFYLNAFLIGKYLLAIF